MHWLSIDIPNDNYKRYLRSAIENALAVDWPDVEVIARELFAVSRPGVSKPDPACLATAPFLGDDVTVSSRWWRRSQQQR